MTKLIHESDNCRILHTDSRNHPPEIIKVLSKEYPTHEEVVRLNNEYNVLSSLDIPGVRKAYRKFQYEGRNALGLEYIDGETVQHIKQANDAGIKNFLDLAIQLVNILSEIHSKGIIHLDINKYNILVDKRKKAWIIDFGIASRYDLLTHNLGNPEKLQGNLYYMSPEQTGRMNRVVDFRSDLYSLGMVFYEMLCGHLPFESNDAVELVHFHLARSPKPPHEVNPEIPSMLSRIVMKLLAKNSDDRYQSTKGLQHDLETFRNEVNKSSGDVEFELAMHDFHDRFIISQKLYGRKDEMNRIMESFSRISEGYVELMLIAGEPGVGKSALVNEIHRPITAKRGIFISGKFDQFQRNIPYYAIRKALTDWVQIVLTERDEKLKEWKSSIIKQVGELGQVLINLIPKLELIIGKQPPLPELGGQEAQNRFNYVLGKFIKGICNKAHPLVMFIDDLQWVDTPSLELIKTWLTDKENRNLLIIGAYRNNVVNEFHSLQVTLNQLGKEDIPISHLKLQNLKLKDVKQLIEDTLPSKQSKITPLAEFVFEKTKGNPIFIKQFLESLYKNELLWFDHDVLEWQWNLREINQLDISENVVDLMTAKIMKVPAETQKILKLASCIGNQFEIETLGIIAQTDPQNAVVQLLPAISESMILPQDNNYRLFEEGLELKKGEKATFKFIHDRVQQAFYTLIPDGERKEVHLRVGRLLDQNIQGTEREEQLFDLAYQYNSGISHLEDQNEKLKVAQINYEAGQKAILSSAFNPALELLETGISLLPNQHWSTHYQLTYKLFETAAEAAYITGEYKVMDRYINEVIDHTQGVLEQHKVYMLRIDHLTAKNKLPEALAAGLDILKKLGIKFSKKPTTIHIIGGLIRTKWHLRGKKIEELEHLPNMKDAHMIAALPVLERVVPPAYMSGSNLFPLIVFKMVDLSLKHGNTSYSAFGYASFGISLSAVMGDYDGGYKFGRMALRLVEKFNSEEYKVKVLFVTDCFLNHWKQHLRHSIDPLLESYKSGLKVGNLVGGTWAAYYHLLWHFFINTDLQNLSEYIEQYLQSFRQLKQEAAEKRTLMLKKTIENISIPNKVHLSLDEEERNEEEILGYLKKTNDKTSIFFFHLNKLFLHLLRNEPDKALHHAESAQEFAEAVLGLPEYTVFVFYESLALLFSVLKDKNRKNLKAVKKRLKLLKKWAKSGVENYQHKYEIIKAGYTVFHGQMDKAISLFNKGIQNASEQKYTAEEAIGFELAGRCFLQSSLDLYGRMMLTKAYQGFLNWGANAKANMLLSEFSFISTSQNNEGFSLNSSRGGHARLLDLDTLMKASTTLSKEIKLDSLLKTMLEIAIENAGAQRGVLIINEENQFLVKADGTSDNIKILNNTNISHYESLPKSIIYYCRRTGEDIVINDALNDEKWSGDEYIQEYIPKSLLCITIMNQGELKGLFYLENKLVHNAFTKSRVELLKMLSGQIATSLENAVLYENLEQKVRARTSEIEHQKKEVEKEKVKSDNLLLNILPAETADELKKYGKTKAKHFQEVSVMFLDIVGFTMIAEQLSSQDLVDELDYYFGSFDKIIEKYKLEKIKTIGDAYLAVGGLPDNNQATASDVVAATLQIQNFVQKEKVKRKIEGKSYFEIKAGINTGPLVAGVVGTKKFQFDIWGDTVNTAARIQEHSEVGKVNISKSTYSFVNHDYKCTYRGKIPAKNKGEVDMYFVEPKYEEIKQ